MLIDKTNPAGKDNPAINLISPSPIFSLLKKFNTKIINPAVMQLIIPSKIFILLISNIQNINPMINKNNIKMSGISFVSKSITDNIIKYTAIII